MRSSLNGRRSAPLLCAAALLLLVGCINTNAERGIDLAWNDVAANTFVPGQTQRAEVLDRLGVPSQILTVGAGTAFYYLQERLRASGYFLILYNERSETLYYNRAVFFFDESGTLTEYAVSKIEDE
jgi:hypothetical protein